MNKIILRPTGTPGEYVEPLTGRPFTVVEIDAAGHDGVSVEILPYPERP